MAFAVPIFSEGFAFDIIAFHHFEVRSLNEIKGVWALKSLCCCPFTDYLKFKSAHRNSSAALIQRNINKKKRKWLIVWSCFFGVFLQSTWGTIHKRRVLWGVGIPQRRFTKYRTRAVITCSCKPLLNTNHR